MIRLRQGVLVAPTVDPLASLLRRELGLGEPFEDDGVGEFGLRNAVMALGDTFIEVIAPVDAGAPAQRWLGRRGPGGYMLIVQVDDVEAARRRARDLGLRIAWSVDLPDISATHLHPRDIGGTLLSVDEARPSQTWHWGGPEWTGRKPDSAGPGRLVGVTVAAQQPAGVARRWAHVLGMDDSSEERDGVVELAVDDGVIRFVSTDGGDEGITGFTLVLDAALRGDRERLDAGGVTFTLVDAGVAAARRRV